MIRYIFISVLFLVPLPAYAESSSSVTVNNSVNASNNNSGDNNAEVSTDIRIETNGKVTEYSSDKPENVEINVKNGVSEIKVDGQIVEDDSATSSPTPASEPKNKIEESQHSRSMLDFIGDIFKSVFSLLL
ncbi:MAG: hypothetical protein US96_C0011G0023 [Candidatus Woesebacteria bacterium GW2011_GWB1_38_5b]|uniref:Uncharacterized protein n=1 Tax=Candidatus Woesebacteria bacterium GW2011_GWB1_38_5b TaxID=1618569 RepID=A0A0G0KIS3_9BACT|nr:MAG: hypothetical protein US96_C0011G0023 [Candidatus Woesebacteria bacterium GW2011_GWB1_38_5b]OGH47351.1 MAG: hypothetical protein A3A51_01100 [Candidatus Levybacteria bacterium RIFCSPLOWO2_01_FULL_39_10]